MSCENPQRVFNKYTGEYVWTSCGECPTCRNRRAARFSAACERERSSSLFTMFVTLTYSEESLPVYNFTGGFEVVEDVPEHLRGYLLSSREHDVECVSFGDLKFDTDADKELFWYYLKHNGIPYASKSDIQLFNKRLNKWFKDHVTNQYKNFRYFIVSELGSTTLRPHFHGLFFVNDSDVARRFSEGVLACWKHGRIDCQYVESSACSYVAQYINKSPDLPSFYKARQISPFYLCSRNPFIGALSEHSQSDEEIFDKCIVETFSQRKKDTQPVLVPLSQSCENRLFPKCSYFKQISDSLRTQLYTISSRFRSDTFSGFCDQIKRYLDLVNEPYNMSHYELFDLGLYYFKRTEFSDFLNKMIDNWSDTGVNWLRRCWYLSRKVFRYAEKFRLSIFAYLRKIDEYWNKKELYLLKQFYGFQSEYAEKNGSEELSLMYPEYLYQNNMTFSEIIEYYGPEDVRCQREDSRSLAASNKRTHFKNIYFESLRLSNNHYYKLLKRYYHAKECHEIIETLAS